MRKIISRHEREKTRKRNQVVIGVILVFVMFGSILGFAFQGGDQIGDNNPDSVGNTATYNGFEFVNSNGLWILGSFVFRNLPQDVEDIGAELKDINNYNGLPLYIYSESDGAAIEISVNLGQVSQRVNEACPENQFCQGNIPTKTCEDNFIIIRESNINMISQDNNCVYIEGKNEDLIGLADQFLFKILGIR